MVKLIPDEDVRIANSDKVGKRMYKHNWEKIIESLQQLDPNFAEFVRQIPYGSIFPRPQLTLRQREIVAITTLTQQNLPSQLKSHIIAGLNTGLSRDQIIEIFLDLAMFIGFPLVLDGLKVAKEVFDRQDSKQ